MFTIYQITNTVNRKSYIGVTIRDPENRWKQHKYLSTKGSDTHFHRAIRKYGAGVFAISKLEEGWDPKIGKNIREPYWISVLKPEYNETSGGDGILGFHHTRESCQKIGNAIRGQTKSPQHREKLRLALSGVKHSLEHRKHESESSKGRPKSLTHRRNMRKLKSPTHRENIGVALRGKTQQRITCSTCGKSGGASGIRRYHFDKCKKA